MYFAVWVFLFFLNFLFLQIGNVSLTGWTFTVALCLHLVVFNSNLVKNVRYLLKRCFPKRQNVLDPRYIISGFIYTKIKGNFLYIHLFIYFYINFISTLFNLLLFPFVQEEKTSSVCKKNLNSENSHW